MAQHSAAQTEVFEVHIQTSYAGQGSLFYAPTLRRRSRLCGRSSSRGRPTCGPAEQQSRLCAASTPVRADAGRPWAPGPRRPITTMTLFWAGRRGAPLSGACFSARQGRDIMGFFFLSTRRPGSHGATATGSRARRAISKKGHPAGAKRRSVPSLEKPWLAGQAGRGR